MMNGGPISWKSPRQDSVSLSTSKAEFVAVSLTGQEAIYLRETLTNFGFSLSEATLLYEENLACVAMSENPVRRKFSRHIDIREYFVREIVLAGFLKLVPLRTHKMVADALTKSLPVTGFHRAPPDHDWSYSFRRSLPTLRRWLMFNSLCFLVSIIFFSHIYIFFMFTHR